MTVTKRDPAPRGLEQTLNTSDESSESFQENLPSINSGELVAKTNNIKESQKRQQFLTMCFQLRLIARVPT